MTLSFFCWIVNNLLHCGGICVKKKKNFHMNGCFRRKNWWSHIEFDWYYYFQSFIKYGTVCFEGPYHYENIWSHFRMDAPALTTVLPVSFDFNWIPIKCRYFRCCEILQSNSMQNSRNSLILQLKQFNWNSRIYRSELFWCFYSPKSEWWIAQNTRRKHDDVINGV